MTDHDVDPRIAAWLREEAPAAASPALADTIVRATSRSRQRRGLFAALDGLTPWLAAAGTAAVLVIAVLWWQSSPPVSTEPSLEPPPVATGSESSSPSPTASPSPSPPPSFEVEAWPRVEIPNDPLGGYGGAWPRDVVVGGPGLVAVGSVSPCCADGGYNDHWGAVVWTSSDGRRWELVPELETFGKTGLRSVATDDNGLMVAAGYEVLPPQGQDFADPLFSEEARVWRSTNGIDWVAVPAPAGVVNDIAWSPLGWVAVGSIEGESAIFVSADLESWSSETFGPGQFEHVAAAGGTVVVAGCFGFSPEPGSEPALCPYRTSAGPDAPWLPGTFEGSVSAIVAPPQGGFIAVGAARETGATHESAAAWTSEDGVAWRRSIYPDSASEGFIAAGVHPDGVMAAEAGVGDDRAPRIWLTHGGDPWTLIASLEVLPEQVAPTAVTALAFRDAQYIVLGHVFQGFAQPAAWHGP